MKFANHHKLLVPISVGLLAIFAFLGYHFFLAPSGSLQALPRLNLSSIDTRIAEKIQTLRLEIEKETDSAELWGRLAMILDIHDFKSEAIPCYQQAAQLDPEEFRWPYYCAIILDQIGDPKKFQWFERSLSLKPDYHPLLIRYAQALFNAGHLEKSADVYNHAITLNKRSAPAYLGLAKIALANGDLASSRDDVEKALKIAPKQREAHGILAEVLRRLGHPEMAAKELEVAERLPKITYLEDPINDELVAQGMSPFWYGERARRFKRKGHLNKAIREIEVALQLSPNSKGYNYLGALLQEANRFEEAAKQYRNAIVLNPNDDEAMSNLAQLSLQTNQVEDALFWAEKALRLNPKSPEPYVLRANIQARAGRVADAIKTLRAGLANSLDSQTLMRNLAWLLATSSQAEWRNGGEAVRLAEVICEKTNYRDPALLDILAAAHAETGRFDKAIKMAERAHRQAVAFNNKKLVNEIQGRLALYHTQRPYHGN